MRRYILIVLRDIKDRRRAFDEYHASASSENKGRDHTKGTIMLVNGLVLFKKDLYTFSIAM